MVYFNILKITGQKFKADLRNIKTEEIERHVKSILRKTRAIIINLGKKEETETIASSLQIFAATKQELLLIYNGNILAQGFSGDFWLVVRISLGSDSLGFNRI